MMTEFRKMLIVALRSGKYQQGLGRLRTERNEFCCLGVACDLNDPTAWQNQPGSGEFWGYTGPGVVAMPPNGIADRLGLTPDQMLTLATWNDGEPALKRRRKSFLEIADRLEADDVPADSAP